MPLRRGHPAIAVQIAKMRFFISLLVDQTVDEQAENRGVRALPNLETKFVAADTLTDIKRKGQTKLRSQSVIEKEEELRRVRERHFNAKTPQTKAKYREQDKRLRAEIAELLKSEGWKEQTARRVAGWDPYDQNTSADFFDPEWMFGLRGGFDVVIGNPPYVRQEAIRHLKRAFKEQYDCYTGVADLYVYFYERALQLLRSGGVLCFISSNKYFRANYGEKLRAHIARTTQVRQVIDFGDADVFTAIAYPSIIVAKKTPGQDEPGGQARVFPWPQDGLLEQFQEEFREKSFLMPQSELSPKGWWFQRPAERRLLDKLRKAGTPLGEYVNGRFYYGIKTGFNKAFVVDRPTRDRLVAEDASSEELLKPFLRGRDVKRWRCDWKDLWLIFTRRGCNIENYPAIHAHLAQFREQLEPGVPGGRKPGSYKWYEIQDNIAYWQEFEQPKIVFGRFMTRPTYAFDDEGFLHNDALYLASRVRPYIVAILNSRVNWYFLRSLSTDLQNGYLQALLQYQEQIPVPNAPPEEQTALEELVGQIREAKAADPEADVAALEQEIDDRVYRLYGLIDEEIRIVEETH